jgi:hypothetical protein
MGSALDPPPQLAGSPKRHRAIALHHALTLAWVGAHCHVDVRLGSAWSWPFAQMLRPLEGLRCGWLEIW